MTSFDGTRLRLQAWGARDAPLVVLVHGLGSSLTCWGGVARLLACTHRVVAYDLRGHGRSGAAESDDYSMRAQARDLDVVLRHVVPAGKQAVVVGHSLGGGIIVTRAHDSGVEPMAGVVFAGSSGAGVRVPGLRARRMPPWARARLYSGWMTALRGTAVAGRRIRPVQSASDRLLRHVAFTSHPPHDAVAAVREDFLATRPDSLAATTLAVVRDDGTRRASALHVPSLVLHGRQDRLVPDEALHHLVSSLPDAELVEVSGEAHMITLTDPETVAGHIARWVRHVGLDHDG